MLFNLKPIRVIALFALVGGIAGTVPVQTQAVAPQAAIRVDIWGTLLAGAKPNAI